jgi:putative flippase GtrA
VPDLKKFTLYLYQHHLVRYLVVGGSTFAIDLGLLVLLHGFEGVWLPLATAAAYCVAITYNFCLNRWWTFSASEKKSLHEHIIPYGVLLGFNFLFTVLFVSLVSHFINYAVAKVLAVAIQTSWTYFCYKHFVFT